LSPGAISALLQIKREFIDDMAKNFDVRKAIRPLLDALRDLDDEYA
jgi:hypothetical protein